MKQLCSASNLHPSHRTKGKLSTMELQDRGRKRCCRMYDLLGQTLYCAHKLLKN